LAGEISKASHYRELLVWQRAIQMVVNVYKLTRQFPREEQFGLTSQLRRAAISVASNIAEGHGRGSTGEYRQFLGMARGSNFEVQTQLVIARELGFGDVAILTLTEEQSNEVGKMIYGILGRLRA
jgi:four helix bundle protein